MGPPQGLPWKGLGTEAPGQSETALLLLPVKACGLCLRLWLTMETTATKNQTPQVSAVHYSPACHVLKAEIGTLFCGSPALLILLPLQQSLRG